MADEPERPAPIGRAGRSSSLAWSVTRDDAPAVEPGVPYLAAQVTRLGRFARIDPASKGRLWTRWEWAGLAFWAVVVAGSLAKAHRDVGGLTRDAGDPAAG